MSYQATVIKVMIASPTDVSSERQAAREIIYEWNAVHSENNQRVLLPLAWETHAAPALGQRPQELINRQVLRGSDLLVAMFWTRLGTDTGVAASGTVEEIEEHLSAHKPAMIYFSSAPAQIESDQRQIRELLSFKESIRRRGLVEQYESVDEFRSKFSRQLAQTVNEHFLTREQYDGSSNLGDEALHDEAMQLLRAASVHGSVRALKTTRGLYVEANGVTFCETGNARSEARCRRVIQDLEKVGYLEARSGRRDIFDVTDRGFSFVDSL